MSPRLPHLRSTLRGPYPHFLQPSTHWDLTAPRTREQKSLPNKSSRRPPCGRSSFAPPQSPTVVAATWTCAALSDIAKPLAPRAARLRRPVSRKEPTPLKDARPRADE